MAASCAIPQESYLLAYDDYYATVGGVAGAREVEVWQETNGEPGLQTQSYTCDFIHNIPADHQVLGASTERPNLGL